MLPLAKRFGSVILCLAVVCGTVRLRGDLSASRGPDALTCDRAPSVPAGLWTGRVSPQLLASGRQVRSHEPQIVVAAERGSISVAAHWAHVADGSTPVARVLVICARAERGPPRNILS